MRWLGAALAGVGATFGLFLVMQALIVRDAAVAQDVAPGQVVDFVRLRPEERVERKARTRPPPPPPPERPPPPPRLEVRPAERPQVRPAEPGLPDIDVPVVGGDGPYIGAFAAAPSSAEGDVVPVVRFAPRYPREARQRRLEGWVRVRFTIEPDGSVSDARVVEAEPRRVFDREAVRAILRWKFKPRIVDGVAVAREAEQMITFSMGGDGG